MYNRRQFLSRTLQGSSLLALHATVPGFIANTAHASKKEDDTILVVVELTGGNDGLNTVIPYRDDEYYKARPTLAYSSEKLICIDDSLGLNPKLRRLANFWNNGNLAIVQGVGYPNPTRSHFVSLDYWQTLDRRYGETAGWLGRATHQLKREGNEILALHIGQQSLPKVFRGSRDGVPSIHPTKLYELQMDADLQLEEGSNTGEREKTFSADLSPRLKIKKQLATSVLGAAREVESQLLQFVTRRTAETHEMIQQLRTITQEEPKYYSAEDGGLALDLKVVARAIKAGFGTRIFYVCLGGFDTHGDQAADHETLLSLLSDAIADFFEELRRIGCHERVILMTFSEFGRRVKENDSRGTDHGAASCLFLVGPRVNGGIYGDHQSLTELDDGDLIHHTDFRQVYASVLEQWLGCESKSIIGDSFKQLAVVKR